MTHDPDWKSDLKQQCLIAIAQLPDEAVVYDESENVISPPSLYQFYEELLAMRNEVRKINRKTAGTFTRFGDVLEGMQTDSGKLREYLNKKSIAKESKSSISRNTALAMVDLLDRAHRLQKASVKHRQKGWRGIFQTSQHEEKQSGAISIFTDHLQKLLQDSKVESIHVQPGDVFDPLRMKAVGKLAGSSDTQHVNSQLIVTQEVLPGYRMGDQCLRPAEVYLTRQNSSQASSVK